MGRDSQKETKNYDLNLFRNPSFPRSAEYDPEWVLDREMGPNAMWFTEALTDKMKLEPGMRVLDLGCGRAMSSVFLAKEYGVNVTACDLWVKVDENWATIEQAGLQGSILPLQAEAHNLPFAKGYFDAIVSIDSYQYFGTADLYLSYITHFLKPGGQLGIVVPGMLKEFPNDEPPIHMTKPQSNGNVFWDPTECICMRTLEFWKRNFERSSVVDIELAQSIEDSWKHWLRWEQFRDGGGYTGELGFKNESEVLEKDAGQNISFHMLVARSKESPREWPPAQLIRL